MKRITNVDNLFFLVSGENPTLPFSEIKSILNAEGFRFQVLEGSTQLLRCRADLRCVQAIKRRSAMVRVCGVELYNCKADSDIILNYAKQVDPAPFIDKGASFVVRIKRVKGSSRQINRPYLESKIGEFILEKMPEARVDLKAPQKIFFGVLTDDRFIFGLKLAEIKPKSFIDRGPPKKAFSHATTMPAKLARCMVNLAQPKIGDLLLDPFCGTGSFLVEAGLIGCRIIGFDVKRSMVKGSLKNLNLYSVSFEGLFVSDARFVPLSDTSVDCIVTDPPYGTAATTLGLGTRDILEHFFSSARKILKKCGRICLAAPKTLNVKEIAEKLGFKHVESHFIYVHRRLTREIAVFQKDEKESSSRHE